MPKDRKIENLPADDLEALTTAQADWDGAWPGRAMMP